jgi:putative transposase
MRYGDLNPVRAGVVRSPKDYDWSSYRHYAFGKPDPLITDEPAYTGLGRTEAERMRAYRALFARPLSSELRIRRPDITEAASFGDPDWVKRSAPLGVVPP